MGTKVLMFVWVLLFRKLVAKALMSTYIPMVFVIDRSRVYDMKCSCSHRCLQARGHTWALIARVISNHAYVFISKRPDAKTSGHQHIAYACTDVRIVYSVVTKYAFRNCASNGLAKSCPDTHTALQAPTCSADVCVLVWDTNISL